MGAVVCKVIKQDLEHKGDRFPRCIGQSQTNFATRACGRLAEILGMGCGFCRLSDKVWNFERQAGLL